MFSREMVSVTCSVRTPSLVLLIPAPRGVPPGRAFTGGRPDEGGKKASHLRICSS